MLWKALKPEKGEVHVTWPALSLKAESPTFTDSIDYCLLMPPPAGNRKIFKANKKLLLLHNRAEKLQRCRRNGLVLIFREQNGMDLHLLAMTT